VDDANGPSYAEPYRRSKTQIAVEYAARLRARAPDTWVFWVDARDAYGFTESYRNIARVAKIPGWEESKTDTLHNLVFEWLKKDQISPWLMILDNNDDADMLFTPQGSEDGKRGKSEAQRVTLVLALLVLTARLRSCPVYPGLFTRLSPRHYTGRRSGRKPLRWKLH